MKVSYNNLYWIIILIILLSLILVFLLLSWKLTQVTNAILEVDENKNFIIKFRTSNINLINNQKDIFLSLNNKNYYLSDVEFIYNGNNEYFINFENDNLYKLLKTNSLYEVKILTDNSKRIYEYIFNI